MTEPELTVIVPCHNEAATLSDQLTALTAQRTDAAWEIVVVDNASTDDTATVARSFAGGRVPVRVIRADRGRGVAYARNEGVRHSRSRSIAFCDGDDVVHPGWTAAMVAALREAPLVTGPLDIASLNPAWLAASRPMGDAEGVPRFGSVPFARGNNCGMHRKVWEALGGYREDFRGLEDIEFSLRATAGGYPTTLAAGARTAYRFRAGLTATWRQGLFYGRGRAALTALAASLGLDGPPRLAGLRSWAWLVVRLPTVARRQGRYAWAWTLANRLGALRGAVDQRRLSF